MKGGYNGHHFVTNGLPTGAALKPDVLCFVELSRFIGRCTGRWRNSTARATTKHRQSKSYQKTGDHHSLQASGHVLSR
ncbi:hypothetical protein MLD38_003540 [Melastoma candidum]|uniref:Uncharacterized protein n=1 Tax=Melastoma candidum TaxID=119954 RepID=A0ACB9S4W2_9MYRT|nr:hypothetical protein MLD38_003540 [Melastoma candidum]